MFYIVGDDDHQFAIITVDDSDESLLVVSGRWTALYTTLKAHYQSTERYKVRSVAMIDRYLVMELLLHLKLRKVVG